MFGTDYSSTRRHAVPMWEPKHSPKNISVNDYSNLNTNSCPSILEYKIVVVIRMINDQCGLLDSNPQSLSSERSMLSFRHGVSRNEAINNVWALQIQALAFNLKSRQIQKKTGKIQVALKKRIHREDRKNHTDRPTARNYVIHYDRHGFVSKWR
jgi:hypothetical protein